MAYWITMKRGKESAGFGAATAESTLEAIAKKRSEGWSELRVIDPNGIETKAQYLQFLVDSLDVRAVELPSRQSERAF